MKNVLKDIRGLVIGRTSSPFKIGVVSTSRPDGGFSVETEKGGTDIVYGDAVVGDTVIYQNNVVVNKLKNEIIKTYYIK